MRSKKNILNYHNLRLPWVGLWGSLRFFLLIFIFISKSIFAVDYYWNATSGNVSNSANWYNFLLPSSAADTRIYFNFAPGLTTSTGAYNDGLLGMTVNSLVFGGSNNFTLSGNGFSFGGTYPSLINNNSLGSVYINNHITLNSSLSLSGAASSKTYFSGVFSQSTTGLGLNIQGGTFIFKNARSSFSGGVNVSAGTFEINATGHTNIWSSGNSFMGTGAVTTTGTGRIFFNVQGADSYFIMDRTLNLGASGAVGANANVIQSTGSIDCIGTYNLDNGTQLIFRPDSDNNGVGELFLSNSTFNFGAGGAIVDFQGAHGTSGSNFFTRVNTVGNAEAVYRYSYRDLNGWNNSAKDFDLNNVSRTIGGIGNMRLEIFNGSMVHLYNTNFSNIKLTFSGHAGGSARALSQNSNVGRLSLEASYHYNFGAGLFFENAVQVSTQEMGVPVLLGNITINSGETAFDGGYNTTSTNGMKIGDGSGYYLLVKSGAQATMDIGFRDDIYNLGSVYLLSNTILEKGAGLNFRNTYFTEKSVYGNIYVSGNITGQGTATGEAESIIRLEDSIGGVITDMGTTLSRQVVFDPNIHLFVQGSGTGGLRIEGSQAHVDGLLTSELLQNRLQTIKAESDQGTLTIAYTDNNASRVFTGKDAPVIGSWIKLGFDNGPTNSTLYQLNNADFKEGGLGNFNGLVVKQSGKGTNTVQLLSDIHFTGAGGETNTSFILQNGTFRVDNGAGTAYTAYFGNATLESGIILDGTISDSTTKYATYYDSTTAYPAVVDYPVSSSIGGLSVSGTITKTTTGTVVLSGRIIGNTASPGSTTAIGLDIQQGTLSQTASDLITGGTNMQLSGGTWALNGNSQSAGNLGTLTVTADSVIDFGSGNSSKVYFAASGDTAWSGSLIIQNWNGTPFTGGGSTQLFFGDSLAGLTDSQLKNIYFYNPNGLAPGYYQGILLKNGECVPVPEASTVCGAIALCLLAGAHEYRRRIKKNFT